MDLHTDLRQAQRTTKSREEDLASHFRCIFSAGPNSDLERESTPIFTDQDLYYSAPTLHLLVDLWCGPAFFAILKSNAK